MGEHRHVVVETVRLTKIFRDFWMREKVKALDSVDLEIRQGEIFGLLGPNGSGKSTLVKILLGLLFPTTGYAAVYGHDPRNIVVKDRIGYMPEESYLYRYLNAEETLNFYGRLFNLPSRERKHRVNLLLDMVGLARQRRRPIVEYSKGMARRIGLAQALINDPDMVFLDEPTTGLDPLGTREMKDLILELKKRGKTVLLCSHLLADVEDVCDRVAVLYGGKVRRLGTVDELLNVHSMTQITTGRLNPETVDTLVALIREMEGADKDVTVQTPRDRLETFFLRVVEEARQARIETAGTTVGTSAASFFQGIAREEKADNILQELMLGAEQLRQASPGPAEAEQPSVVPAGGPKPEPDKEVLQHLVGPARGTEPSEAEADAGVGIKADEMVREEPIVLRAGEEKPDELTTKQVLDSLLDSAKDKEKKEADEEE